MDLKMNKIKSLIASLLIITQLSSCGFIMYPQRRGQAMGEVDWTIASADSIGLLLLILPGVIALSVDISSGAIYLGPHEEGESLMR